MEENKVSRSKKNFKRIISIFGILFIFGIFIFVIIFFQSQLTGQVTSEITTSYKENEILSGSYVLSLKAGELIPSDSIIKVELNGESFEYSLSELINNEEREGDFYTENVNLGGSGKGYGIKGEKEVFSDVSFVLEISKIEDRESSGQEQEEQVEEVVEEPVEEEVVEELEAETTTEIVEEPVENSDTTDNSEEQVEEQEEPKPSIITGQVVSEIKTEIKGVVSKNNPYTYELKNKETAEIVSSSQDVKLVIENDVVTITTNYAEVEEGFGEEYIGEESIELSIDLSSLDILAKEGDLKISVSYQGSEISSISTILSVESPDQTVVEEPVEINKTTNETITVDVEDLLLTTEENFALQQSTGSIVAKITKSKLVNDRLIIRFEMGEFWLENSYDYDVDEEELSAQIILDGNKWRKRLAQSILESGPSSEDIERYIGEVNSS